MKVISIITIIAAILYFYLTITAIRSKKHSISTWLLAASSFALMYWSFLAYFTYNAKNIEQLRILFQVSVSGMFVFLPLQLFFVRSLQSKLTIRFILIAALPAAVLFLKNYGWEVTFTDFFFDSGKWVFVPAAGLWNCLWKLYISITFGYGIIILFRWYKKTDLNREKKQIKLLAISSSITMVLSLAEYYFHPFFSQFWTVPLSPVLFLPWVTGYVLAISRYQFLNISPENITRHILESVDEFVILTDFQGKPTYMNKTAKLFFKNHEHGKSKPDFKMFIGSDQGPLRKRVALTIKSPESNLPILDFELTKVLDKFDDPLGFLIIAREIDSQADLSQKYNITAREIDVIGAVVNGAKTRIIAEQLEISERTVKSHIASIYQKTGVSSRVELLNLVMYGEDK